MKRFTCGCLSVIVVLALALAGLLTWAQENAISLRPVVIAGLVGVAVVYLLAGRKLLRLVSGPDYTPEERERLRIYNEYQATRPRPDAARYDDWHAGGAARYQADCAAHLARYGGKPPKGLTEREGSR